MTVDEVAEFLGVETAKVRPYLLAADIVQGNVTDHAVARLAEFSPWWPEIRERALTYTGSDDVPHPIRDRIGSWDVDRAGRV